MTRTNEPEPNPSKREVERFLCTLERPSRNEYSVEIERRAIHLLRTRADNEWRGRLSAGALADVLLKVNKKLVADLKYARRSNVWMVAILVVLIGLIVFSVWRSSERSDKGRDFSSFAQMRQR